MIKEFLKELRESADVQFKIFTEGSCYRLFMILKILEPKAIAYWSDLDNHCITRIEDKYYDIGGEVKQSHIEDRAYYQIPESQLKGYALLKYTGRKNHFSVKVEKYI